VKLDRPAAQDFVFVLAGEQLATVVSGDLLTAAVPSKLFNSPGSLQLLVEAVRHARKAPLKPVIFKVQGQGKALTFCLNRNSRLCNFSLSFLFALLKALPYVL
jgi:hypothetical protein